MEETQRKKKKIWKILKWIMISFLLLILAAIVTVGIYAYSKFSKLGENIESGNDKFKEEEIIINDFKEEEVGVGFTNFVLFGADSRDNDVDSDLNTDSIIVVNLNNATKEIKLLSVYRDTLLDMTNGSLQKCNSAYRRGGAKQAINMLNMNLDLQIQKYVTVNFSVVSDVIDMLGGVEVDVSEAEMKAVNKYLKETAKVAGKEAVFLTEAGVQTLDGVQATTYARIRKGVGNDYARTERQRELITLTLQKAVKADLATINNIIDVVFPQISTNFTLTDVLKYAKDLTKYQISESSGFPFDKGDGTVSGKGSCVYPITLESNVTKLHEFLYDIENYQPSEQVCSISQAIEALVNKTSTGSDSNDDDSSDDDTKEDNTSNNDSTSNEGNTATDDNTSSDGDTSADDSASSEGDTSADDGSSSEDNTSNDDGSSSEGDTSTNDGTSSEGDVSTDDSTSTEDDTTMNDGTSTEDNTPTVNGISNENDTLANDGFSDESETVSDSVSNESNSSTADNSSNETTIDTSSVSSNEDDTSTENNVSTENNTSTVNDGSNTNEE